MKRSGNKDCTISGAQSKTPRRPSASIWGTEFSESRHCVLLHKGRLKLRGTVNNVDLRDPLSRLLERYIAASRPGHAKNDQQRTYLQPLSITGLGQQPPPPP